MRQSEVRDENVMYHARRHCGLRSKSFFPGHLKQNSSPYVYVIYMLQSIGVFSSYIVQFYGIKSSVNYLKCLSRSFVVVRITRNGVTEIRASRSCFKQLTPRKSSVLKEGLVSLGTKNEKGRFVVSAGTELSFKENAKHSR